MLRGMLLRSGEETNRRRMLEEMRRRRDELESGGQWHMGWLQGLDLVAVSVLLCDRKVALHTKRVLMAVTWGNLPTGSWLQSHGYEAEATCGESGAVGDVKPAVCGCTAAGAGEPLGGERDAERAWQTAMLDLSKGGCLGRLAFRK